jgi:uncharacterized protein
VGDEDTMHVFYLHGFASSASSSKACFFAERLGQLGLAVHVPDLNAPDFSTLTTTRMIGQVEEAMRVLEPGPVTLIGSSLGAFVAWHTAARQAASRTAGPHPITHLVLLAPALEFGGPRMTAISEDELRAWRETGWREFVHHAFNERRRVHYALLEDARTYVSAAAPVTVPTLIFQGLHDVLVDADRVRAFAASRPFITLHELDDDHQLHSSLEIIWDRTAAFLELGPR